MDQINSSSPHLPSSTQHCLSPALRLTRFRPKTPKSRPAPRAISRLGPSCLLPLSRECHIAVSLQRVALSALSAFSSSALRLASHCHRPFSPLLASIFSRWCLRISSLSIKLCLARVEHCHFFRFPPLMQPQGQDILCWQGKGSRRRRKCASCWWPCRYYNSSTLLSATNTIGAEDIKALTKRKQDGVTEVVEAKAEKGSATLSMAYAGVVFADAFLKGLNGVPYIVECSFVQSTIFPGLPFFVSKHRPSNSLVGNS